MKYKQKLTVLLAIIALLSIAYILGRVFDPERVYSRSALFSWLDPKSAEAVEKIVLSNNEEIISLVRKNNAWFVQSGEKEYPARQLRIADLINVFTRRSQFPVLANSAAAHEKLGLLESSASRISISGAYGQTLLDLLIGYGDATGQNIYLRKFGNNEVRSGEDKFSVYLSGGPASWYNLRLIPETEDNSLDIDKVQRVTVYQFGLDSEGPQIITRKARQWTFNKIDDAELDMAKVDSYIQGLLYTEGDDFSDEIPSNDPVFRENRIIVEFGTGEVKTIYFSAADETNLRYATVSGTELVYTMAEWMAERLYYTDDYYKKEP